jgi:hypothetical protein
MGFSVGVGGVWSAKSEMFYGAGDVLGLGVVFG